MGILDRFRKKKGNLSQSPNKKGFTDSVENPKTVISKSTGRFCSYDGAWCEKDICDNCKASVSVPEATVTIPIESSDTSLKNEKSFEEKVAELNKAAENKLFYRQLQEQKLKEQQIELERIRAEEALPELPHAPRKHQVTPNICDFCGQGFLYSAINRYSYYNERPHIEKMPEQHYLPYTCDYCGGTFCD